MKVLLCPLNDPGYLYPALAVGAELRRRAHTVHVLAGPRGAPTATEAGLETLAVEDATALSVSHWTVRGPEQYTEVARAVRQTRPDVLVTSVLCHGALVAAEAADLPVVVLGLAAHLWPYRSGTDAADAHDRTWRLTETLKHYGAVREAAGLAPRHDRFPDTPLLGAAFLLRGHPALEPPGAELPRPYGMSAPAGGSRNPRRPIRCPNPSRWPTSISAGLSAAPPSGHASTPPSPPAPIGPSWNWDGPAPPRPPRTPT